MPQECYVGDDRPPGSADPRRSEAYWTQLRVVLGLDDPDRYGHLPPADRQLLEHVCQRCRSAFWLERTPHTVVKGFLHDVITEGTPVRQPPYRLRGLDQQDVEKCVQDDLRRGQLTPGDGSEEWTSPGFVVRAGSKMKMVVDYRRLNQKTKRSVFLVPRGDDAKSEVAQAWLVTLLDAVWGFNQIRNTLEARRKLAMITLSGIYQPICLPFGPLNGPETFQRMMHQIFADKLNR